MLSKKRKSSVKWNSSAYQKCEYRHLVSLVHQINFLEEVLKLKVNFQKNKIVPDKTTIFAIGPFCTHHSICLNGFWYDSFVEKMYFQCSCFQQKKGYSAFWKRFSFSRKFISKLNYWKRSKFLLLVTQKNMSIS